MNLELLAPARDAATAVAAISHGADAVYIGAPAFGARAAAGNTLDDIAGVVSYAHLFGAKVYVTVNTIIFNNELDSVRRLVCDLWRIGVDALIVQDMALLTMDIPPIDLHASTQCDARTPDKIRWLAEAGFSQIVLPREFSLAQIAEAARTVPSVRLETFVHGALCVSYSGDCHAGAMLAARSANRGDCPQVCRLKFTLTDEKGKPVSTPDGGPSRRHWLSLADMNRLEFLSELTDAGISSFKIEGRLKSRAYVKNVTLAYSKALDDIVAKSGGRHRRSSVGRVEASFIPAPDRAFNRGFTPYFLKGVHTGITSWQSPKWIGRPVAETIAVRGNKLKIKPFEKINNGDGLGFFAPDGSLCGFRINRAEGQWLFPAQSEADWQSVEPGTVLYRNSDTAWESLMARSDTARRTIALSLILRPLPDGRVAIDASDERGAAVTVASEIAFTDRARTPQNEQRRTTLSRLGDTIFRLEHLSDTCGDIFIPSKDLTSLRREVIASLGQAWELIRQRPLRHASELRADSLHDITATYHDNIANHAAEDFYASHGARVDEYAIETDRKTEPVRIMTTRYCLRRELGCCLRGDKVAKLPPRLFLDAPLARLRLDFDCVNCNMQIYST